MLSAILLGHCIGCGTTYIQNIKANKCNREVINAIVLLNLTSKAYLLYFSNSKRTGVQAPLWLLLYQIQVS